MTAHIERGERETGTEWLRDVDILAKAELPPLHRSLPTRGEGTRGRPVVLLVGAVMVFTLGAATRFVDVGTRAAAKSPPAPRSAPATAPDSLDVAGRVVVRRAATVSSAYTAQLKSLFVREGDVVREGQVVAQLDSSEASAAISSAESRVAQLRAARRQALAALDLRRLQLTRSQQLADRGFAASAVVEELTSAVRVSQAEVDVAGSGLAAAEADLVRAQAIRDRLTVRAPFAGQVSAVSAEVGEVVSPASNGGGFVRTGICTLLDLSSREIELFVPERYLRQLRVGEHAVISADALAGTKVQAQIAAIRPEIDVQRGAVRVVLRVATLDERLLPNMNVNARVRLAASGLEVGGDGR